MVSRPLISEEVANQIKSMIISGELEVGMRLPAEQELARKFNVSIRSIREGVKSLVSCNVLEVRRGVGTFVCATPGVSDDPLGLEFLNLDVLYPDLLEVRTILEPEIFVLAAHRGLETDFQKADEILDHIQNLNSSLDSPISPTRMTRCSNSSGSMTLPSTAVSIRRAIMKSQTVFFPTFSIPYISSIRAFHSKRSVSPRIFTAGTRRFWTLCAQKMTH